MIFGDSERFVSFFSLLITGEWELKTLFSDKRKNEIPLVRQKRATSQKFKTKPINW
jgi:hypothetical protein